MLALHVSEVTYAGGCVGSAGGPGGGPGWGAYWQRLGRDTAHAVCPGGASGLPHSACLAGLHGCVPNYQPLCYLLLLGWPLNAPAPDTLETLRQA